MKFFSRSRSEFAQLLLMVGVVLAIPPLLPSKPGPQAVKPAVFDQATLRKVLRQHPNVVMIGNSMLYTRVDIPLFNDLVAPNSTACVAEGGTRSTVWYFMLKNFVGPIDPPPEVVIIFYRDYDFTTPWMHLEGERLETARTYMKPEDEELLGFTRRLGGVPPTSPFDFYLPEKLTLDLRNRIGDLALDVGAFGEGKEGDNALQQQLTNLFDFQNLRSDVFDAGAMANDIVPGDHRIFTMDPAQNLLEKFNTLAKERGIRLIFYRVKRRPNEQNEVIQDAELRAYTAAFRGWAERQGHRLIDETEDPRLTLSMYHDGDHLGKAAMAEYTRIFLERIKPYLPLPPRATAVP